MMSPEEAISFASQNHVHVVHEVIKEDRGKGDAARFAWFVRVWKGSRVIAYACDADFVKAIASARAIVERGAFDRGVTARLLLFQEQSFWIASAIEYDVSSQGNTEEKALASFARVWAAQAHFGLEDVARAPAEYEQSFEAAEPFRPFEVERYDGITDSFVVRVGEMPRAAGVR